MCVFIDIYNMIHLATINLFILVDTSWRVRPKVMNSFMAGSCELAQHPQSGGRKRFGLF